MMTGNTAIHIASQLQSGAPRKAAFLVAVPFNHVERRTMSETIAGIKIPDSKMAKDLTELIRDKW
jgi:hypothetical protein